MRPSVWLLRSFHRMFMSWSLFMEYLAAPFLAWFTFRMRNDFLIFIIDFFRSVVIVSFYFDKKRAIANGIMHIIEQNLAFLIEYLSFFRISYIRYRNGCSLIRSIGGFSNDQIRLENWNGHICWDDVNMYSLWCCYETIKTKESTDSA